MAPVAALAPRPVRMPKLTYRNRLPDDQTSLLSSTATSASDACPNDPYPDLRLSTSISTKAPSPTQPSFDTKSVTSASVASTSSNASSPDAKTAKKKSAGGVLNFLTLKEPSHSALEQYAQQQRKQAGGKGRKSSPAGMSAITQQKLPPTVPKVNSKWDGVPESIKSRGSTSNKRHSALSQSTSRTKSPRTLPGSVLSLASYDGRGAPNSLASSVVDVSRDFSSTQSTDSERRGSVPSITSSNTSTLDSPTTIQFFPHDPSSPSHVAIPHGVLSLASPLGSPSEPPHSFLDNELGGPANQDWMEHATWNVPSSNDMKLENQAEAILKRLNTHGLLADAVQDLDLADSDSDSELHTGSHDFLFQDDNNIKNLALRALSTSDNDLDSFTKNFSRPISRPLRTMHGPRGPYRPDLAALPVLYEASICSSLDTGVDTQDPSSRTGDDSDDVSRRRSLTPTETSATAYESPRERLGLGSRIRKNDMPMPWESQQELPGKLKKGRRSLFGRTRHHEQGDRSAVADSGLP
ncbi:hypothetical protein BDV95DRAFT_596411 [Massariosphaeria phaeospora]|uniref:Uncharacterized protein n=1 Tax=Massariosphaeria phaeospora TaxID=100035 RepID=A0A7C8M974_9PLEO|nr:hypothetical protein BDV95DRAFT_596411 [Massariosphaeria phaeospora]